MPAVVLLRITLRFRGGSVFWIFALLGSGFVAMAVGDILYAYLSILGSHGLEPFIDAAYVIAYLLVARGAWQQVRVST